jgi:peptidoglycan/LPS O-acetylase OafA/YrhL
VKYIYKNNNLDFLRLILATSVVFLHLSYLTKTKFSEDVSIYIHWLSGNAVSAFFIVSGFLIYMSFDKKKSIKNYLWSRFLRLYPAYFIVVSFSAIFFVFLSSSNPYDYFTDSAVKYFFYNSIFLNFLYPSINAVFESHPEQVINGSLWTLKIEVMFYLLVPLLYLILEKKNNLLYMLLIYVSAYVYKYTLLFYSDTIPVMLTLSNQLPGQMMYFISGVFCFKYFTWINKHSKFLFIASVSFILLDVLFFKPFTIAILITIIFISLPNVLSFKKIGDLSYGIYIYHFPIIQVFIAFGVVFDRASSIFSLFFILFLFSFISWKCIEAPFLKMKNKIS